MNKSKEFLQDKSLAEIKLIFKALDLMQNSSKLNISNKNDFDLNRIYENSMRFSFQQLASYLSSLSDVTSDNELIRLSGFLNADGTSFDLADLEPRLTSLQIYLLATLL
jgi:hypothetical protein